MSRELFSTCSDRKGTGCRDDRPNRAERPADAESLLRLGKFVRFRLRHGAELAEVARELGLAVRLCRVACQFAEAPDVFKLRGLFESWNRGEIASLLVTGGARN